MVSNKPNCIFSGGIFLTKFNVLEIVFPDDKILRKFHAFITSIHELLKPHPSKPIAERGKRHFITTINDRDD